MSPAFEIQRTRFPRPRPGGLELGFGRFFTDHMFLMSYEQEQGWGAGKVVPYGPLSLDPASAGLHYGQTLFEGLKAFPDPSGQIRIFRMEDHLARLNQSARYLCIPPLDLKLLGQGLGALVALDADWMPQAEGTSLYIRPLVVATEAFLGVRPAKAYTLCAFLSPVGDYYSAGADPVRIWVEEKLIRAAEGGLGAAKTGANYAVSLRAAQQAKARGFAQVLWLDAKEHRYVEEVGTMNLFVRLGEEVVTPPLEGTLLPGVTRSSVLTLLREWGVEVSERRLCVRELRAAHARGELKEVFGTGTAAVISPVGELGFGDGNLTIAGGQAGELSVRLRQAITDIQYGRAKDPHGWLSKVEALESAA